MALRQHNRRRKGLKCAVSSPCRSCRTGFAGHSGFQLLLVNEDSKPFPNGHLENRTRTLVDPNFPSADGFTRIGTTWEFLTNNWSTKYLAWVTCTFWCGLHNFRKFDLFRRDDDDMVACGQAAFLSAVLFSLVVAAASVSFSKPNIIIEKHNLLGYYGSIYLLKQQQRQQK